MSPHFLSSIKDIAENYEVFVIDLWGVMHDGEKLYPNSKATLEYLRSLGKKIVFLSNAPRLAIHAENTLTRLGVERDLYDYMVTSGQVAYDYFKDGRIQDFVELSNKYYYMGPTKDIGMLDNLGYESVALEQASFILNTGYDESFASELDSILQKAKEQQLPMICINPDIVVVRQSGKELLCAGYIAEKYKVLRGRVHFFGKPYFQAYENILMDLFPEFEESQFLCIGDNFETDIAGAQDMGLDNLFIMGGIYKNLFEGKDQNSKNVELDKLITKFQISPQYCLDKFF